MLQPQVHAVRALETAQQVPPNLDPRRSVSCFSETNGKLRTIAFLGSEDFLCNG